MRHLKSGRKLNRTASHRKAMLNNLATSILDKERVTTTVVKAKEVRGIVERQITYGKKGTLAAIRLAGKTVKSKDVLKKLFDEIAPGYKEREGGYTRIVKTTERDGDNAPMCIIELVGRNGDDVKRTRKKKKKATRSKAKKTVKMTEPSAAEKPAKKSAVKEAAKSAESTEGATAEKKPVKKVDKAEEEPKEKKSSAPEAEENDTKE